MVADGLTAELTPYVDSLSNSRGDRLYKSSETYNRRKPGTDDLSRIYWLKNWGKVGVIKHINR
jgi:hypothetical protein